MESQSGRDRPGGTAPALPPSDPRDRFVAFAFAAADLMVEAAPDGRILFAAGAFPARFGQDAQAWVGRGAQELVAPEDRAAFGTALELLSARGRLPPTALRLADRARAPFGMAGLAMPADPRWPARLCLSFAPLPGAVPETAGLPAGPGLARQAEQRLRAALARAGERDGETGALGLLELAGPDGPLTPRPGLTREIGAVLAEHAGPDGLAGELSAGRYGVLSGATPLDLGALAARLEALLRTEGLHCQVSASSLPLATGGLTGVQATRALRYALGAFGQGGAPALAAAGFDGGLAGFVAQAGQRAGALRRTIAERRFRLAFQPIVGLGDRLAHHHEALLRPLPTPGVPMAQAQEFVTFAETVGLSEELDWAVLETAFAAARRSGGARIACNLSGLSLQSPGFRDRLLALLDANPDLGTRILFEITETAEIEDEAQAVATTEALRARGLPLCIDDFGAGSAAFRYLRIFRVDFVKVDGLYVRNAVRSERDRRFVAAMVDLAGSVGAQVVAEQIETEAQAEIMESLGVHFGQGWLYGRPGALPGSL